MKFDAYTRRQAQALFDAIARHAADATKTELDALRAGVDARIASLQKAVAHPDQTQLVDRLVEELSTASRGEVDTARTDAEKAGAQALVAARQAADAALKATQTDLQGKLAVEQKNAADLRKGVDDLRRQLKQLQDEHAGAQATAQAALAAAQNEFDRTKSELEKRLEQVQAARAELARVLAETQRDAAGARAELASAQAEVATQTANFTSSQARLHALEHESTEILLERDQTAARLEAELQRAVDLEASIGEARHEIGLAKQEASLSKVDAEGRRQGLEAATERIRILEEELRKKIEASGRDKDRSRPAAAPSTSGPDTGIVLLDLLGSALESIDVAISASEILETLIEQLGRHFVRAAVFLVGPSSFKGWRGSGLGPGADISNIEIPRTIDSLLARSLTDRKPTTAAGNAGDPAVGVLGSPVATALALPVFANGRVIAVAYAEHTDESAASLATGCKIAEILIDHANRRLTVKRRTAPQGGSGHDVDQLSAGTNLERRPASYSPARQAQRLAMRQTMEVSVEGSPSLLVDLSTLGAQVVSPVAMRPKRVVRITLPDDGGGIVCKARVVWAQFEQPNGTETQYRAGVKFTEVDAHAVEQFLSRHGMKDTRHVSAKLEESA